MQETSSNNEQHTDSQLTSDGMIFANDLLFIDTSFSPSSSDLLVLQKDHIVIIDTSFILRCS